MFAFGMAALSGVGMLLAGLVGSGAPSVTSQQLMSDIGRYAGYMVLAWVIGRFLLKASGATQPEKPPSQQP